MNGYLLVHYDEESFPPGLTDNNADLLGFDLGDWHGEYKLSYWHPRVYLGKV